ncbi:Predicted nucleotidyltransferases [Bordetella ansorpii]|uniref:Predicted nucleotidyltransferases n=1 Tax=Bordetella ansorpii TaxID=288768 RepID=A0A157KE02_9BORD|nr:restriction endonuclease subunit S [Bordetella ansorpii]SAH82674.1 Predicted nucleotidyltransferases [Bordetella ansorpii]
MASKWRPTVFGELVDFVSEKAKAQDAAYATYVSTENMQADFGGVEIAVTVPKSGSVTKFIIGDTLFSNIRTYFKKVWQAEFDGYCSNDVLVFRTKDETALRPGFLNNLCRWEKFTEFSIRTSKGAKMPRGDKDALAQFKFELPSIEEQRAIAKTLRSFDNKIDLNRRINQTLEAMAQAIFKSWFVDFDPVKAKIAAIEQGQDPLRAAMRATSGKTDAELDQMPREHHDQLAATAALFPDAMEESELGETPKGWSLVPFGSLLSYTIGGDWGIEAPDTVKDTRVAIIRGTDIPDLDQAQLSRVPIRYTNQKKLATRRLQVGDIVLEVSGGSKNQPTGRSFYMTANALREFDCPVEPASFCRLLRPVSIEVGVVLSLHLSYIYQQGKTWEYQNQSTGIANFQTSHFLEAELVVAPPNSVLEVFFRMVSPILERRHDAQGRKLALTRDTLLPKLMSGELSVSCPFNEDAQ